MLRKLQSHWWSLPSLSALLLVLAFHPFNLWPLAFVALAPLYAFAILPERPGRQVFWGGFITGGVFALSLSYFTVVQFRWVPQAHLFADLVHFMFIPIGLLGGLLCGGACVLIYRLLRTRYAILNILLGAAAYTLSEILLYAICGGYYFAMLGYAASSLPFLVSFASIGGAFLVSFIVALVSTATAETLMAPRSGRRSVAAASAILVAALSVLCVANAWYLRQPTDMRGSYTIASIQTGSRNAIGFGREEAGVFVFPALADRLTQAASSSPDLLIYPFSPIEGALYVGAKPSLSKDILVVSRQGYLAWTAQQLPASTTLMTWTTLYEAGKYYNVFDYSKGGALVAEYRKRDLFPFIDYTPQWAQRIGFYSTQIDEAPGEGGKVALGSVRAAPLLCSEIHQQGHARTDAFGADFIVSAGSEAIFVDGVASEYSLKAAQFRAAESDVPAVRANTLGPSAIIDRGGSIQVVMPRGASGVLKGTLALAEPHVTPYAIWGNALATLLCLGIFALAFAAKARARYNI